MNVTVEIGATYY